MIPDSEPFVFASPPDQEWMDNLVEEYLALDIKMGKLNRFIEDSPEFHKMSGYMKSMMKKRLKQYRELSGTLYKIAKENGVWEEIMIYMH